MLSCRFCFKSFPLLGRGQVFRSMEDPTVCEACYKAGTDLNAKMRDQANQQSDARTDGYPPNAHVIQVGDKVYPMWDTLPQQTTPPPEYVHCTNCRWSYSFYKGDKTNPLCDKCQVDAALRTLPQGTPPPQNAYPEALKLTPEQLFSIGPDYTPPPAESWFGDYTPCRTCGGGFWRETAEADDQCESCRIAAAQAEEQMDITPAGGKHSAIGRAFHHLDPELMLALAGVLYTGGAKYGRDNWKNISVEDHLNHAFNHVYLFQIDRNLEDLEHAILRLMFAWTVENEGSTYAAAS